MILTKLAFKTSRYICINPIDFSPAVTYNASREIPSSPYSRYFAYKSITDLGSTWRPPGRWETLIDTAKRELYEETGALEFYIEPVCLYSVTAPNLLNQVKNLSECCFLTI